MNTQMPPLSKPLPPSPATKPSTPSVPGVEIERLAAAFRTPGNIESQAPSDDDEPSNDLNWRTWHKQRLATLVRARAGHRAHRGGLRHGCGDGEDDINTFVRSELGDDNAWRIVGVFGNGGNSDSDSNSDSNSKSDSHAGGHGDMGLTPVAILGTEALADALDTLLKRAGIGVDTLLPTQEEVDSVAGQALVLAAGSLAAGVSMKAVAQALIGSFRQLHARLPGARQTSLAASAALLRTLPEKLDEHARQSLSDGNGFLLFPLVHLAMTRTQGASHDE